ncbi:hypothetical protein MLD38_000147 [Melastoma candidum]|uniref:Uncharacterized protein n=1 Tax=Melastoma candidum TaxID=119954 RepID=A0ACB9SCG0_9MYRT|nr:hypothetical protein MLD38_000147 [Melastoma candidum]
MADQSFAEFSRTWPCAACTVADKLCTADCIFSLLFPPDRTTEFEMIHKVFGEMNSRKLLTKLPPEHRKDAADSLVYEAEARLRDPLNGCVGTISSLQRKLDRLKKELAATEAETARYAAMMPEMSESAEGNLSDGDSSDGYCVHGKNMMADLARIRALTHETFKLAADPLPDGNGNSASGARKTLMDKVSDIAHYVAMMPGTSKSAADHSSSMVPGTSKSAVDHSSFLVPGTSKSATDNSSNGKGDGDGYRGKNKV